MKVRINIRAGRFDEPEVNEFYVWAPDNADGTPRTEWYVRNAAQDPGDGKRRATDAAVVAGPLGIDAALRESARRNAELEEK